MHAILVAALLAPAATQPSTYSGTVVAQGKPIAGATLWLQYHSSKAPKGWQLLETRTDATGRFELSPPKDGAPQVGILVARAADGRLAWLDLSNEEENAKPKPLRLELLPVGPAQGRLTARDGQPLAKVRVLLNFL